MQTPSPVSTEPEPYAFVCYAHEDADVVYPEIVRLRHAGFHIWYDEGISPGAEWTDALARQIECCSVFLYFVTPRSVQRAHCRREVVFALDQPCRILAVHLEPTELPPALRLSLNHRQAIRRYGQSAAAYQATLERALSAGLSGAVDPDEALMPSPPGVTSVAAQPLRRRMALGLGAAALLLVVGWGMMGWPLPFGASERTSSAPGKRMVVGVHLPEDLTGLEAGAALPRLLAQDLVAALSRETPFRVVPLFGAGASASAEQTDYQLRGIVRNDGSRVRVSLELIPADGAHVIWTDDFGLPDGAASGLDKAPYVANVVRESVFIHGSPIMRRAPFTSDEARALTVRAIALFAAQDFSGRRAEHRTTIRLLEQAATLDPEVPLIHYMLANTYAVDSSWGENYRTREDVLERWRQARAAAQRGAELKGEPPHGVLVVINYLLGQNFAAARRHIEARRKSGFPASEYHLGNISFLEGDFEQAVVHFRASLAAGGETQDVGRTLTHLALTLGCLGRYAEALDVLDRLQRVVANPGVVEPWLRIRAHAHLGDPVAARQVLQQRLEESPPPADYELPHALALVGRTDEALALLDDLELRYLAGRRFPCMEAFAASVYLNDLDRGFVWLERGIDQREVFPRIHGVEFDALEDHPRFQAALQRMARTYPFEDA